VASPCSWLSLGVAGAAGMARVAARTARRGMALDGPLPGEHGAQARALGGGNATALESLCWALP